VDSVDEPLAIELREKSKTKSSFEMVVPWAAARPDQCRVRFV
jgi:hypothetical protein